jgi:hypothetical protein
MMDENFEENLDAKLEMAYVVHHYIKHLEQFGFEVPDQTDAMARQLNHFPIDVRMFAKYNIKVPTRDVLLSLIVNVQMKGDEALLFSNAVTERHSEHYSNKSTSSSIVFDLNKKDASPVHFINDVLIMVIKELECLFDAYTAIGDRPQELPPIRACIEKHQDDIEKVKEMIKNGEQLELD